MSVWFPQCPEQIRYTYLHLNNASNNTAVTPGFRSRVHDQNNLIHLAFSGQLIHLQRSKMCSLQCYKYWQHSSSSRTVNRGAVSNFGPGQKWRIYLPLACWSCIILMRIWITNGCLILFKAPDAIYFVLVRRAELTITAGTGCLWIFSVFILDTD